jgi:putative ABC transport system permease protein
MKTFDMMGLALGRLRTSRLRTALTMLGVIIGVASVVALVAVGQGSTASVTNQLASLGTNLVTVNPDTTSDANATLTVSDAEALMTLPSLLGVAPEISSTLFVTAGDDNASVNVLGTTAAYPMVRNFELWQGSGLTDISVENELRIAVLGSSTAENLGLDANAIGSQIKIDGLPFTVVGIFQEKGGSGFIDPDDFILVPISTMQKYFVGSDDVRTIGVSATEADGVELVKADISEVLRLEHDLPVTGFEDDFTLLDQAQLLETASAVSDTLTLMLAGIASISLIVGGIGIMNIMLVSVRERTREIGIRKAIGARSRDILSQFLIESVTLSLIGGLIGVALGVVATFVIGSFAEWDVAIDPTTILIAVGFSVAIGVIFGVWPARQAARLDPIEALHYA